MSLSRISLLLSLTLLVAGCDLAPNILYTRPEAGATGVAPDTEIAVGFSTPMEPETVTDTSNYTVMGSHSGTHQVTATYDEETRELLLVLVEGDENLFTSGETVTVSLTSGIVTTVARPIRSASFSFRIAGDLPGTTLSPLDPDQFTLTSTLPIAHSQAQNLRPAITANFSVPATQSTVVALDPAIAALGFSVLSQSFWVYGEISGSLPGSLTFRAAPTPVGATSSPGVDSATFNAGADFIPGERVAVTLTRAISSLPVAPSTTTPKLRPYTYYFDIAGGHARQGFAAPAPLNLQSGLSFPAPMAVVSGEFLPNAGLELVVLESNGGVSLLYRTSNGRYLRQSVFTGLGAAPVAMRRADLNADRHSDILVLTADGRVSVLEVLDFDLVRTETIELPGLSEPSEFEVADIDGNGLLDFVLAGREGVAFFEQRISISASGGTTRAFVPNLLTIPRNVTELEIGDLDRDGRLDLITRGSDGYRVFANNSDFEFVPIGTLTVDPTIVRTDFQFVDFEGDRDLDVVIGTTTGLLVFENSGNGLSQGGAWVGEVVPLAGGGPDAICVRNANSDPAQLVDLVAYFGGAAPRLDYYQRNNTDSLSAFAAVESLAVTGALADPAVTLVDTNDDSGLDLLLFGAASAGTNLWVATARDVLALSVADFTYSVPAQRSYDLGPGQGDTPLEFVVSANLGAAVESFRVALDFDETALSLERIEADPAIASMVTLSTTINNSNATAGAGVGEGFGIVEASATAAPIPAGQVGLVRYVFSLRSAEPGSYAYTLTNSLDDGDGTMDDTSNLVFLTGGSQTASPVFTPASGRFEVTASVPAVTNLACAAGQVTTGSGEQVVVSDVVHLTWTIPSLSGATAYDLIRVLRNGSEIGELPGTAVAFTDFNPRADGVATYQVIGRQAGVSSPAAECSITLVAVIQDLVCLRTGTALQLTWSLPASYTSIAIFIDGAQVAQIGGTQQGYTTTIDQNGHTIEVVGRIGADSSAPAVCVLPDLNPFATAPPTNVVLSVTGDDAQLSWVNGELYTSIEIRRFKDGTLLSTVQLTDGQAIGFTDADLAPGLYSYSVSGDTATAPPSAFVTSNSVVVALLAPDQLVCASVGMSVQLTWNNRAAYSAIEIYRSDAPLVPRVILPGSSTMHVDTVLTDGSYSYTVRGVLGAFESDSTACVVVIQNLLRVADLTTGVGLASAIEIRAQTLEPMSAFGFTIEYDGAPFQFASITGPLGETITPSGPTDIAGSTRKTLTVSVSGLLLDPGQDVLLARIHGQVPSTFAVVGQTSLVLSNATFDYLAQAPALDNGNLVVRGDVLDVGELLDVEPGDEIFVPVFGTYDQEIQAFTALIAFDPTLLVCNDYVLSAVIDDQLNPFFTDLFVDDEAGVARMAVVGLGGAQPTVQALLFFLQFTVNPAAEPGASSPLVLLDEYQFGTQPVIDTVFASGLTIHPLLVDGRVRVAGTAVLALDAIAPDHGPVAAATNVILTGSNFAPEMTVTWNGTTLQKTVNSSTQASVLFPAGLSAGTHPIRLALDGQAVDGPTFSVEALTIASLSPSASPYCSSSQIVITGTGMVSSMVVKFKLGADEWVGTGVQVFNFGRSATLMSPTTLAPHADVDVELSQPLLAALETATLLDAFDFVSADFVRGDVNLDGVVNIADLSVLQALLLAGEAPVVLDAADVNDDGVISAQDVLDLRAFVTGTGTFSMPAPYPAPGPDPTADNLYGCSSAAP